jgi:rfaE bifunctional protein nucleotidyltransferase chain/domain/rfaE bifunctional protein kinase chain/domain
VKITVVGDTLLDVDVRGTADRLSPDAPVPVVDVETTTQRPGGAGLVATMLARDGHSVRLVSPMSSDTAAGRLRACLAGIEVISGPSGGPTPVKTRIRVGEQSVVRVDKGCSSGARPTVTGAMLDAVTEADVLLVADYGRGLTADATLRELLERRGASVPLVWDPHPKGAAPVASATVATPNLSEATNAAGLKAAGVSGAAQAAAVLHDRWKCGAVVVTMGSHGALVRSTPRGAPGAPLVVPANQVACADPCGAGDRFSATLAVQLGSGTNLVDAVRSSVADASAYLAAGGVSALEMPRAATPLGGQTSAFRIAHEIRERGGTVVATGGCFDLLHAGHIRTLSAARALGDCLIVCMNSDESVRRLKGNERPIVAERDRADLLMALECVDGVVVFDEDTPEDAIRQLHPDVWVKGGDYVASVLPEATALAAWGGQVVTVPFHPGYSTTHLAAVLANAG